jgi:hypothetical protein
MKIFNFSAAPAGLATDTIEATIVNMILFLAKIFFMILLKLFKKGYLPPPAILAEK